ncbi:MAG: ATP-binding protein, partial [Nitriliruptor sp.]|uniref:two-component system sensor histidine kinase NtrB n=1 Tax=Nitriliruptor sp. TaxID=2448056 RepID=UPI0034A086E8
MSTDDLADPDDLVGRFVDLSPDAIAILDLHGTVERCNDAFVELFGAIERRDLVGRALLDLVADVDRDRAADRLAEVLFDRQPVLRTDLQLRRTDGARFPAWVSVGHLGEPQRRLQVVVRDLSERVRAETERARLGEQLAQAHRFETVGQLAGGLAHDLNNLLTVLVTSLGLADESLRDLAAGGDRATGIAALTEDLQHLRIASDRVDTLTRKLLQFASRSGGAVVTVVVADLVADVADLLGRSLGGAGLETSVADDTPDVRVDSAGLEQAITNLVLNARDAAPGGRITLEASRGRGPGGGPAAIIVVADEGTGMPPHVVARAFEPLFTTKPRDHGTGLGLPSVRAFVEQSGGTVHIDTAVGEGTRVTITLPELVDVELPVGPASAPSVLVVDPSDRSGPIVAAMLVQAGYRVEVVASAADARRHLDQQPPAVLLIDLVLPDGGALDVVARADASPEPPAVVLLSSTPDARPSVAGHPVLV